MWTCLFGVYFLILLVLQVKSTKDFLCDDVQPIQDSFSRIFNSFEDFSKPQNVDELLEFYEKNQLKIKEVNEVIDEEFDFQPNHSVSKVQFLFKKSSWWNTLEIVNLEFCGKIDNFYRTKYLNFSRLNWSKIVISWF